VSADDMTKNYVGLPEDSTAFNDTFTKADYEGLVTKMVKGDVKVSNDTSAEKPVVKNITLDFQGNLK
ncbi:MAG: BMP family ABC transporter substrate-binding protein, partial [Lachnospiraceae bacterium]|nr:BMP family ABC transporter substrate-binding protein [Lachnospiraceae bacterium]